MTCLCCVLCNSLVRTVCMWRVGLPSLDTCCCLPLCPLLSTRSTVESPICPGTKHITVLGPNNTQAHVLVLAVPPVQLHTQPACHASRPKAALASNPPPDKPPHPATRPAPQSTASLLHTCTLHTPKKHTTPSAVALLLCQPPLLLAASHSTSQQGASCALRNSSVSSPLPFTCIVC